MQPEQAEVRRWRLKARRDWSVAEKVLASRDAELDIVAFHCQQAAEKLLKALLVSKVVQFEKVHDLGRLVDHCARTDPGFEALRDSVEPLTIYAVAFRYPGPGEPTRAEVERALQAVKRARSFVCDRLPREAIP